MVRNAAAVLTEADHRRLVDVLQERAGGGFRPRRQRPPSIHGSSCFSFSASAGAALF